MFFPNLIAYGLWFLCLISLCFLFLLALYCRLSFDEINSYIKNPYRGIAVRNKINVHDGGDLLECRPELVLHELLAVGTKGLVVERKLDTVIL